MQDKSVKKLFTEQVKYYSQTGQSAKDSPLVSLFLKWACAKKLSRPLEICEFGGAGGILLNEIDRQVKLNTKLYNVEIIGEYKKYQVSQKIHFVKSSILDSGFDDQSFDVIIVRDVLHHLVGRDFKETKENQEGAIKELKRLIRPKSLLLIEEMINESVFVSRIIYFFSKLNSKIGTRVSFLEITPNTIVCFLQKRVLEKIIKKYFGPKSIVKELYFPEKDWRSQIVHLGVKSGKLVLAVICAK